MASVKIFYKGQDLAYYGPTPFLNLSTQVVKDSAERDILGFKTTISLEGKLWVPRKDPANANDSNALSSNALGIENLLKLEKHMRELFKEHGILKMQCGGTDLTFGLAESVTGNAITGSGVFCKVNSLNFSRTDDNWTRSIDYNIELEHYTKAGVKHPCAKHFPVVSYSDDWSVEPIDDPSYYLMNTQNNLRQLGNIFTQVYPVGNNRLENLIQYRITHRVSAVGAYAPTGLPPQGQAEGASTPYHGGSPWLNAKQFVHCQVKRGNDQINHIFLSVDNSAANYPASFKNDASKYASAPQADAEPKAYLYNHSRLVNVSETAGSYEISDSWLAMSKPAGYTEQYSVELTQDLNNVVTARINGSIQGLELKKLDHNESSPFGHQANFITAAQHLAGTYQPTIGNKDNEITLKSMNETNIYLNKYDNALYAWRNYVEPMMYVRSHTFASMSLDGRKTSHARPTNSRNAGQNGVDPVPGITQDNQPIITTTQVNNGCPVFNKHASDILLDPKAMSKTIGSDPSKGTITYSCEFNSRTGANQIKGGRILSISVQDTKGSDVISEVFVLGRKRGPVLQDSGSKSAKTRQLSMEIQTNIPKGLTEFDMRYPDCPMYTGGIVYKDVLNLVDMFRPVMAANWSPVKLREAATNSAARGITVSLPVGSSTVGQLYVIQDDESWNPLDGKFTKNITWKYDA
jgi:hypothetical protein